MVPVYIVQETLSFYIKGVLEPQACGPPPPTDGQSGGPETERTAGHSTWDRHRSCEGLGQGSVQDSWLMVQDPLQPFGRTALILQAVEFLFPLPRKWLSHLSTEQLSAELYARSCANICPSGYFRDG